MSGLSLNSETLSGVLEEKMGCHDAVRAYLDSAGDSSGLLVAARALRERHKGRIVTFSKKVFLNVINLCRDSCSYCTYKAEPSDASLSMMSMRQIREMLALARRYGCVEALLVTGERPEQKYPEARRWLREQGFGSTAEYLAHASEAALEAGLFPHTNAGNLEAGEMKDLAKTNASLGIMLENVSGRLAGKGMPHHAAPSKRPEIRLEVLEDAGRLGIPMTTGILIGIGETPQETVDSLLAIREIHKRHGNIQEVIIQNFQPKSGTAMGAWSPADTDYFMRTVALARVIMPDMNIQIPPNLSPGSYEGFLSAGINDWGGISPLTPDFVNPEFAWPSIDQVEAESSLAGYALECRFPVYPEFFGMVNPGIVEKMLAVGDRRGMVRRDYWK